MRTYRRITYEDRCQLYALRQAGKTQDEIGRALGFSKGPAAGNWLETQEAGATAFSKRSTRRRPDSSRFGISRAH